MCKAGADEAERTSGRRRCAGVEIGAGVLAEEDRALLVVGGGLRGELVAPESALSVRAAEVAAREAAPATRSTYASVYRAFTAALGLDSTAADVTPQAVRAWRDRLELEGRSPATIAKHLSALRSHSRGRASPPRP